MEGPWTRFALERQMISLCAFRGRGRMKCIDQSAERFFCVLVEQKNKQNNNRRYKMNHCKTIAIVNQKGGVGKTTSTVNLGVGLAQAGNRVLLVDDDPQHSLTISLGIRNANEDLDTTPATAILCGRSHTVRRSEKCPRCCYRRPQDRNCSKESRRNRRKASEIRSGSGKGPVCGNHCRWCCLHIGDRHRCPHWLRCRHLRKPGRIHGNPAPQCGGGSL